MKFFYIVLGLFYLFLETMVFAKSLLIKAINVTAISDAKTGHSLETVCLEIMSCVCVCG